MSKKKFFPQSIFLTLSIWVFISLPLSAADTIVVRIMSYNILHGATTQGDFDLDRIAKVILDVNPDLVALQEVDFKTNRAKKYDLVTELGIRTNLAPIFGRAMDYDGGEYGEGILSRYSFLTTRNVLLPNRPGKEPRAALEVTVELPSGDTISFIGTHLDHTRDETDRIAQARKINNIFDKNRHPSILAGDLNAGPDSETIRILEEHWTHSYSNPDPTFRSDNPTKKIDYILFAPKHSWKVVEREVICDEIASDHCSYLAVFQLINH